MAVELQGAYKELYQKQGELEHKYEKQSNLLKEALVAIQAWKLKLNRDIKIYLMPNMVNSLSLIKLSSAVKQYKVQLNTAQSNLQAHDQEHQLMIKQLQDKISLLEVTLASQANLPLVAMSNNQEVQGLHSQVFDYILGTVNTKWGLSSMTAKTKHSHSPTNKSGSRKGTVVQPGSST